MQDILVGRTITRRGMEYTVKEVDRTCYQPNHSPSNPWLVLKNDKGESIIGALHTVAPELA
jgi:hypothetical protein